MQALTKVQNNQLFKIRQKAWKCIQKYALINDGDKILIGLSGGKDSLALTEILGERMKISTPSFTLVAAHVSVSNIPYTADLVYLEQFAAQYNIPFVHTTTKFDATTDSRKSPCFLCSWNRRKSLFDLAKANGCNKIALGHHQDDILETLLLNMSFQGAFGSMPPKLSMNKFDMTIIRPLSLLSEKEMMALAEIRSYQKQIKNCPYEKDSYRAEIKKLIQTLEAMNPNVRSSMWNSMTNIQQHYLPKNS